MWVIDFDIEDVEEGDEFYCNEFIFEDVDEDEEDDEKFE